MPASSRKRNKGRDRKEAKKAKEEETERVKIYNGWQNWSRGLRADGTVVTQCNHGFGDVVLPDISHPVSRFISDYFSADVRFNVLLQKHQEVQNNDDYRKMATDILILIETNWLIDGDETIRADFPQGIVILENYGKTGDYFSTVYSRNIATKRRNLLCGSTNVTRDLLKFYRKRITCKCLKKRHLEARKTLPKLGECNHCGEAKERRLLLVCSRCMIVQYCSRECQVAASPEHRTDCDIFVRAHNNIPGNYNFI